jgi:ABC-type lipoprotein release transport system permease subunit
MILIRLGLEVLRQHLRLTVLMALAVAVPVLVTLELQGYQVSLRVLYEATDETFLVVQTSGSMGEFYGSRLPASLQDELFAAGASLVIPEIHTIVGTTQADAILLRGIPLAEYQKVERFRMLAGRPLQPGDASRLAMIGMRLAEERNLTPGDNISIRGRSFTVLGVFEADTYAGNEAWISLEDAQTLLGWNEDVSVYLIPVGERFKAGDHLPGGASIVQQGDSGAALIAEWGPFFRLLELVIRAMGFSAAVSLASILWRLAWLQRRELAILRSLGFGSSSLSGYLLAQGAAITLFGMLLGWLGALALKAFIRLETAGISLQPALNVSVLLYGLTLAMGIALFGTIIPIFWLSRFNLSALLRAE